MADQSSSLAQRLGLDVLARQFSRFLAVGAVTTIVHYGVLIALVEALGAHPVLATTAGFLVAALLSYVLNRRYTFDHEPAFGAGLLKYYAALSIGLLLNAGVMAALTQWGVHYVLAQVVATGVALVWNFTAARLVVFRS